MVSESPKPNGPRAQQFLDSWSILIGPEYARILLPIRRAMLVGIAILLVGLPVSVFVASIIPNISFSVGEVVVIALILLSATPLVVSGVQFIKLEVRIQRDLEAAGYNVRPGGPDLRSVRIFESWSKRSGISAQNIISTGRVVLGDKE